MARNHVSKGEPFPRGNLSWGNPFWGDPFLEASLPKGNHISRSTLTCCLQKEAEVLCLQTRHLLCLQTRHLLCQQTRHLWSPKTSPRHWLHRGGRFAAAPVWAMKRGCLGRPQMSCLLTQEMSCLLTQQIFCLQTRQVDYLHPVRLGVQSGDPLANLQSLGSRVVIPLRICKPWGPEW